jgi:hypothetical protein
MGLMVGHLMKNGMERQKLQDVLLHVINRVVGGATDGSREKIVVENYDKKVDETLGRLDFDEELYSLGYKKLTSEPWLKMLAKPNFDKFKEQDSCPKDMALINSLVFRKTLNEFTVLEIARPESFLRRSAQPNESHYSAALFHQEAGIIKRGTWFLEDTERFADKIAAIEAEAVKIAEVFTNNIDKVDISSVDLRTEIATGRIFETADFFAKESMSTSELITRANKLMRDLAVSKDADKDTAECRWITDILDTRFKIAPEYTVMTPAPKPTLFDKFLSFFK